MKKSEFKKLIKPIVAECIKESLLEGGVISGVIAEVVRGMSAPDATIVETKAPEIDPVAERMKRNALHEAKTNKIQEHRSALMKAVGKGAYNGVDIFEGVTPLPPQASTSQQASPLSGQDPSDAGVDISGIFGSVAKNWGANMTKLKEGK